MIELYFNKYRIEIFSDDLYTPNSTDNIRKYDYIYSGCDEIGGNYRYYSKFGVYIWEGDVLYKSAILISGAVGNSPHKKSAIINNDSLVIILGNIIVSITLPDLLLNWITVCENCVSCFDLYRITEGYIIHGELSIIKINEVGKIEWEFFGRDIFTTPEGNNDFQVFDNSIIATDWGYNKYKIDINNGDLIK